MRIVLANHQLLQRAGSELYTLELATALKDSGHDVVVFTFFPGEIARAIEKAGIRVHTHLDAEAIVAFAPDVLHIQHSPCLYFLGALGLRTAVVLSTLGPQAGLETPPLLWNGVSRLLAVSEETAGVLRDAAVGQDIPIDIVRNWFDDRHVERISPKPNADVRRVAVVTNHLDSHLARDLQSIAARHEGFEWFHFGAPEAPVRIDADVLRTFDAIISIGRTSLLAAATGTPCLLYDVHGCDGWLDIATIREQRAVNFSGRWLARRPEADELEQLLFSDLRRIDRHALQDLVWQAYPLSLRTSQLETTYRNAIASGIGFDTSVSKAYSRYGRVHVEGIRLASTNGGDDTAFRHVVHSYHRGLLGALQESQALRDEVGRYDVALREAQSEATLLHAQVDELRAIADRERNDLQATRAELQSMGSLLAVSQEQISVHIQEIEQTRVAATMDHLRNDVLRRRFDAQAQSAERSAWRHLRVLYVADRVDAPYRYRCANAIEQLRDVGVRATILPVDAGDVVATAGTVDVVVLFRLGWSDQVDRITTAARKAGAQVILDIDDYVFDPEAELLMTFLSSHTAARRERYRIEMRLLRRTLDEVDMVVGATPMIAAQAIRLGKRAAVHPNLLSRSDERRGGTIARVRSRLVEDAHFIYPSGSNTHDRDLASIAAPLTDLLRLHPTARLILLGHVEPCDGLRQVEAQIVRVPYQPAAAYPWLVARCSAVLAPIETLNAFFDGKSDIKVTEAGIAGVPTIASPTDAYRHAIKDGASGFVCDGHASWRDALDALCDQDVSLALGAAARAKVLKDHVAGAYRGVLASLLTQHAGTGRRTTRGTTKLRHARETPCSLIARGKATLSNARAAVRMARRPIDDLRGPLPARRVVPKVLSESPSAELPASLHIQDGLRSTFSPQTTNDTRSTDNTGWWACDTNDPWIAYNLRGGVHGRFLRFALGCQTAGEHCTTQLFWHTRGEATFSEQRSIRFESPADGVVRTIEIDLEDLLGPDRAVSELAGLRIDPMDAPGRFYLNELLVEKQGSVARQPAVGVDIIIPVYNAKAWTLQCIASVLRHASADWRLRLIDDASTEAGLRQELERIAHSHPRVELLVNDVNAGFVKTANRGMRAAEGRDVLLLNSDTEVFAGFLDGLRRCAYSYPNTGIVTPFSNNATIYSIPKFAQDNPIPDGFSATSFAELVTAASRHTYPNMVTGVGFCMYIRAEVLARVGYFDDVAFPTGYGEENDLCQRARAVGFTVRLADDVFVYHKGRASFLEDANDLRARNEDTLRRRHPGYHVEVARFVESNPLAPLHETIHWLMARRRDRARHAVLFLLHASPFAASPGGTEHHVLDLVTALRLPRSIIAYRSGAALEFVEVVDGNLETREVYRWDCGQPSRRFEYDNAEVDAAFDDAIDALGIGGAHIHHLMTWPTSIVRTLIQRGIPYVVTAHDYYLACQNWNLYDHAAKRRCECADASAAGTCLEAFRAYIGEEAYSTNWGDVWRTHRDAMREVVLNAAAVVAPSQSAMNVLRSRLGDVLSRTLVINHGYDAPARVSPARSSSGMRAVVLGEVAHHLKGAANYLELVRRSVELDIEWHFFGEAERFGFAQKLRAIPKARLVFHGPYQRATIIESLRALDADLYVGLPIWDETFSYTLSEALVAGLPALVADVGALAERVREGNVGFVVPDVTGALGVLADLKRNPARLAEARERASRYAHPRVEDALRAHRDLYEQCGIVSAKAPGLRSDLGRRLAAHRVTSIMPQTDPPRLAPWADSMRRGIQPIKMLFPAAVRRAGNRILARLATR